MYAEIRGHTCWYEARGDTGPPVLLVMGFGMSGRAWGPLADRLATDHRTVLYDVRGLGSSPSRDVSGGLPRLADDAAALLDHLGWDEAHVAGVSMGGMIAQHLAIRHTHRVRSLTLIATHPGPFWSHVPGPTGLRGFLKANRAKGEARLEALRELLYPPEARDRLPTAWSPEELAVLAAPAPASVRLAHLAGILAHDARAGLRRVHVPALVVRPGKDVLVPPSGSDVLAEVLPRATVLDVPEGGHGVLTQVPDRVADAMRALIRDAEPVTA